MYQGEMRPQFGDQIEKEIDQLVKQQFHTIAFIEFAIFCFNNNKFVNTILFSKEMS